MSASTPAVSRNAMTSVGQMFGWQQDPSQRAPPPTVTRAAPLATMPGWGSVSVVRPTPMLAAPARRNGAQSRMLLSRVGTPRFDV